MSAERSSDGQKTIPGHQFEGVNVDLVSAELSSRRTGLSFQRTRMSADRTLMSSIRTSLSLISFGFTIFQVFRALPKDWASNAVPVNAGRNFGTALVVLGAAVLVLGITYHINFMKQLRLERKAMVAQGLLHGELTFPSSATMISAVILLLFGIVAIISMLTRSGPLG
jgi:putative membrane protein